MHVRVLDHALFALSTWTAIFGPGGGARWVPAMFAVVFVLVGRLTLRQNIRLGTTWRSRLYGGDDKR